MKYINKFNTQEELQNAINNGTLLKPYLVTIGEIDPKDMSNNTVDNNTKDIDRSTLPLSFEMLSAGTWTLGKYNASLGKYLRVPQGNFFYRINDGEWIQIISKNEFVDMDDRYSDSATTIEYQEGDVIQFKGYPSHYDEIIDMNNYQPYSYNFLGNNTGEITGLTPFNVYGNIMSIFYGDDYKDKTELPVVVYSGSNSYNPSFVATGKTSCSSISFQNSKVVDASELYIPLTGPGVVNENCNYPSFQNCSLLEKGPVLRIVDLTQSRYAYENIFNGCSSLRYVKCLTENQGPVSTYGGYDYLYSWISDCPSDGVFVKKTGVEWVASRIMDTIYNSIPTGWTVEEADK